MKQKLFFFIAVIVAQSIWGLPFFLTKSREVEWLASMTCYVLVCLGGHLYVIIGLVRNKIVETVLSVILVVSFLVSGLILLAMMLLMASRLEFFIFPIVLLCALYLINAGRTIPKELDAFMVKRQWLKNSLWFNS